MYKGQKGYSMFLRPVVKGNLFQLNIELIIQLSVFKGKIRKGIC